MKKILGLLAALAIVTCASVRGARIVNVSTDAQLVAALASALPGDDITLADGTFGTGATSFIVSKPGTAGARIAIHGKTPPCPGCAHATIKGRISFAANVGDYYDFYNVEMDGLGLPVPTSGHSQETILFQGKAAHLWNVSAHTNGDNCLSTFGSGNQAGQVIEDFIGRDCHYPIYAQNDFDSWGYKQFKHVILMDARDRVIPDGNNWLFHGYTEGGINAGFSIDESVFTGGRWIMGSRAPNNNARHEKTVNSIFYKADLTMAYTAPTQWDAFDNNYILRGELILDGICADCPAPNHIVGNTLWNPGKAQILSLRWMKQDGTKTVAANPLDLIDGNHLFATPTSTSPDWATYWFPNSKQDCCNQTNHDKLKKDLQDPLGANCKLCEATGDTFQTNPNRYWLYKSATVGQGILTIIRGGSLTPTTYAVDLSPVVAVGSSYAVIPARLGWWGTPVLSGTYTGGTVAVPLPGEFEVYVVVPGAASAPPTATPSFTATQTFTPTNTRTPTWTASPTATFTNTPTDTPTDTPTPTPTPTSTPTNTPTDTPTPTPTMSDVQQQDRIIRLERAVLTPTP